MSTSNCVQAGASFRASLFLLVLCILSVTSAHGQSGKSFETATAGSDTTVSQGTDPAAAASQAAGADAVLRGLAEKNALTVRALVGFGRIPAADMAPLAGLRGKGIDVLGATPEQLDAILTEHGETLSSAEKQTLSQVSQIMREASNPVSTSDSAAAPNAGEQMADTQESAHAPQDTQAMSEPTQTDAAASFVPSRPAPAPLPPMPLPPALPMVELSGTQYAGMISTAKEATRTLMGRMSEAEAMQFEKRWASYYDFPTAEISDHFRALTPLLSEFLNIREAIATTSAAFDEAWGEARLSARFRTRWWPRKKRNRATNRPLKPSKAFS